ncbi:hypothetical protein BV20DRAFT_961101 [Pilatotrama ljubarskyi]|nr:hypothetical protein BV20DRAFT_961101 [Pilatotrama ljubarskyi]
MGSSGNESRNDDSQASQLLAAALRPRELQPTVSQLAIQEEPHVSDGSLQSSGGSSVHYHINGLMPTQTQSLYESREPPYDEGSQKENAPMSPQRRPNSPPTAPSRNGSPRQAQSASSYPSPPLDHEASVKGPKEKPCPKVCGLPNGPSIPATTKAGKAVAFASPSRPVAGPQNNTNRATIPPSHAMPPPKRFRSPSPASQDSFAGPLPERDPVEAFLQQAKHLDVPLSQLGEDSQSISEGEDGPPPVASNMWASRLHSRAARPPSSQGKVLVEGTPSNSSRSNDSQAKSQSQSQSPLQPQSQARRSQPRIAESQQSSDGSTQLSDLFPPGQGESIEAEMASLVEGAPIDADHDEDHERNRTPSSPAHPTQSDTSTQPTSSYERLVNQDPFAPDPEVTQPAPEAMEETQAVDYSRPTHETDASSIVRNHDFFNENGQIVFPSVPSEARSVDTSRTRSTIPGGLMALVAPHKRYRYQDISASPGPSTQILPHLTTGNEGGEETQVSDVSAAMTSRGIQETQPSEVSVAMDVSEVVVHPVAKRTLPTATRALQALRARQQSKKEIVPDSEEMRIVPDSDPPEPTRASSPANVSTAQSSPAKPRSRRGLQSEEEVLQTVTMTMEASAPPTVSAIREEEEEEDDEDEVPLAATVKSAKAKGKQRAELPESYDVPSPSTAKGRTSRNSPWKGSIVPSSDPQERRADAVAQPKSKKARTPVEQIAPALPKPRTAPRQAKLAARERLRESPDEEDVGDDQDIVIPDQMYDDDDDKDTQPAEDEMDVDTPAMTSRPSRGGKRKRTVSSSVRKNSTRSNGARPVKEESSTPATRPTKRLKSGSHARIAGDGPATRVFALWKQDGHYYSGTVQCQVAPGKYEILFDDGDKVTTELKHMRTCRLREGDNVLLNSKDKAKVVSAPACGPSGHQASERIIVDLDKDGEEDVEVQQLRLAPRTVSSEWGDRVLTDDVISPVVKPKLARNSPTPGASVASASEGGAKRKPLYKVGIVVTLSAKLAREEERQAKIAQIKARIAGHGGVVVDDWACLFKMEGMFQEKRNRWTLRPQDIAWQERTDIDRAFLMSDDNSQKPKFLMALALGIPCLSAEYLDQLDQDPEDTDWQPYLLPAGFSEHLNTRVSQLVDLDWGNSEQHLSEITENLVPAKVFSGKSILCISRQFVPCRRKNANTESAEKVPLIVLCMGAKTVEAVTDEKYASRSLDEYDYVVLRDDYEKRLLDVDHCVSVSWVKDCLISGRLLPVPERTPP